MPELALRADALGPGDEQRVGHAALEVVALPHLERRVESPRPADRIVVVGRRRTKLVEVVEVLLDRVGDPVEELVLVDRTVRTAFARGAVVGNKHHDRVVEVPGLLEEVEQPPDLVVGVREEASKDLGHAAEQLLLLVREGVPWSDHVERRPGLALDALFLRIRVQRGQLGALREDPELLLSFENKLAIGLVAHVELALVLLDPLLRRVMRSVAGAWAEVHEERLVGRDRLGVLDELDRLVGEVRGQVVSVLGHGRLVDRVVVVDQVGIPLVGLAAEEAVVALEPAPDRPVALRGGHVHLVGGDEVPLAEHVRVPPTLAEDLGERGALEWDVPVRVRVTRCGLCDAGHPVGGVVAPGQQRGARRRAERGRVPVGVGEAGAGQLVDVRCLDQAAPRLHRREADVVQHDVEHAWCARRRDRLQVRLPVGSRVPLVELDLALELLAHLLAPSQW